MYGDVDQHSYPALTYSVIMLKATRFEEKNSLRYFYDAYIDPYLIRSIISLKAAHYFS